MKVIRSITEAVKVFQRFSRQGKVIGFVPTMGALHQGHMSLIRRAIKENDLVVVSIFVNPAQFGQGEDFKKYPRNLRRDVEMCKKEGVDIIFSPAAGDMYPDNYRTYVAVEGLSEVLCGKFRLGHFKGVATVVAKLFNIVQPTNAYFGQKDAQQAAIIKKMVWDLNLAVKIRVMSTLREQDGLAMSSRNVYLAPDERRDAVVLSRALNLARLLIKHGNRSSSAIIQKMKMLISQKKSAKIQYISIVDADNLEQVSMIDNSVLIALAVYFGRIRLIDNVIVNPNKRS